MHYSVWTWPLGLLVRHGLLIGSAIGVAGLALNAFSVLCFKESGEDPDWHQSTSSIIESGPYAWSRNPMYVGAAPAQLGIGIAVGSAWVVLTTIPAVLLVRFFAVLPEERYLEKKFGARYHAYAGRVADLVGTVTEKKLTLTATSHRPSCVETFELSATLEPSGHRMAGSLSGSGCADALAATFTAAKR